VTRSTPELPLTDGTMSSAACASLDAPHLDARTRAAAAGDRDAQGALLREHLPRVRNLVRYLLRGDDDVDDTAQVALCEVVRCLASYRGDAPLTAWIDRITARTALRRVRTRRAEARRRTSYEPELHAAPYAVDERYLARRRAVHALDLLPEDQRAVVVLHHVLGLSVPELAEELEIPFETARSRLRLGMDKLRLALTLERAP
jgi:RNA polymerase sigma-70 factor (ECF subfamily)